MLSVKKRLGTKLRELRQDRSYYEVGNETSISRSNLRGYEEGTILPSEPVLRRLASFYGIPYEDLRILYYADYYDRYPEEREIVIRWVTEVVIKESQRT